MFAAPLLPLAPRRASAIVKPEIARILEGPIRFWTAPSGTPFPAPDEDLERAGWKLDEADQSVTLYLHLR